MNRKPFLLLCALGLASAAEDLSVRIQPRLPATGRSDFYAGNRPPLIASPLIKLPLGAVRAEGWLARQLELMADGFTGRLTELSRFCRFEGNAWTHQKGQGEPGSANRGR